MALDSTAPVSRRTVTKGIAWSVPAVAIAGAAPAFATSGTPPQVVLQGGGKIPGQRCKYPAGNVVDPEFFYGFNVTFTNSDSKRIYLFPSTITYEATGSPVPFVYTGPSTPIPLEPGQSKVFWFGSNSTNSAFFAANFVVCIDWGHEPVLEDDTHPHELQCSAPLYIEMNPDKEICPLLFGQPGAGA